MSSSFPDSPDSFTDKQDNVDVIKAADINNLQDSVLRLENSLSLLVKEDDGLLSLCHFEGKASGYRNLSSVTDGAVRYEDGKYGESIFVERGTLNYVKNPALRESDSLWTFTAVTGSLSCSRVSSDYPPGIDSQYCFQVNVDVSGSVGGNLTTTLEGLSAETDYSISFWVKNVVGSGNFTGDDMKITYSGGSGVSGSSYVVTSDWTRVSGSYTTASGQDSFVLEIDFSKSGAVLNDSIFFGGFQVEEGSLCSSYCDGDQGLGYSWSGASDSSSSIRSDTIISYPVSSSSQYNIAEDSGSLGFWFSPDWDNGDDSVRYLFDTSSSSSGKRISVYKDADNKLNFGIYEPGSVFKLLTTDDAVDWEPASDWKHFCFTYNFDDISSQWDLSIYVDGDEVSATGSGSADTSSAFGDYFYLGSSCNGENFSDGRFDDFFIYGRVLFEADIQRIFDSPIQLSEGILRVTQGSATTDASIGSEISVSHGLGEIPSFIDITEKGAGVVYLSSDSTNEYFYVKSTGSSIDFAWRAWPGRTSPD